MKQRARDCGRLEAAGKSASELASELDRYNKWRRGAVDGSAIL